MRTTIVIFTDHKVPVSEIPNYKLSTSIKLGKKLQKMLDTL